MSNEKWTTMHIHLDIQTFLKFPDKKLDGLLCDAETKESLTPAEVREFLLDQAAQGYKYFSPCGNRKADGSCAGHRTDATDRTDGTDGEQGK